MPPTGQLIKQTCVAHSSRDWKPGARVPAPLGRTLPPCPLAEKGRRARQGAWFGHWSDSGVTSQRLLPNSIALGVRIQHRNWAGDTDFQSITWMFRVKFQGKFSNDINENCIGFYVISVRFFTSSGGLCTNTTSRNKDPSFFKELELNTKFFEIQNKFQPSPGCVDLSHSVKTQDPPAIPEIRRLLSSQTPCCLKSHCAVWSHARGDNVSHYLLCLQSWDIWAKCRERAGRHHRVQRGPRCILPVCALATGPFPELGTKWQQDWCLSCHPEMCFNGTWWCFEPRCIFLFLVSFKRTVWPNVCKVTHEH